MRRFLTCALLFAAGCRDDAPPAPTSEQAAQLNEAEAMLDELSKEEGPEQRPGPSNSSNH